MQLQELSREDKIKAISLLQEKVERLNSRKYLSVYESFYDWQREFVASTAKYHESCLCAANQIGKTYTGTDIDAMHLLGDYPDDWEGHKFDFAPMCWGLGYSMEKTRDLLQKALFGEYSEGSFTGGLIPKEKIVSWESASGTANAMRTVRVEHVSGESSTIQFWSYSQGQHAIMGDVIDWVHIDEEPKDQTIRPQVLTRTINGDKGRGGRIIYTFTPENGRTELVIKFMDDPSKDQFFMMKGWADAPHITKEKQDRLLEQYPAHQRDMRTKGVPMLGHGRIYDLSEEFITCEPFDIPEHWAVIGGMDFGWDHPQAQVRIAWDRDSDVFYLTHAWKQSQVLPEIAWSSTKEWQEGVPVAWPHDGNNTEKGSGKQQKDGYIDSGFTMLHDRATWEDEKSNGVEAGIMALRGLMSKGKFKVFNGVRPFFDEYNMYHRDNGKIVKTNDDVLDSVRYAYMMRRYSINMSEVKNPKELEAINFSSPFG